MRELDNIKSFLKNYDGPDVKIMEVCGTHTAAIMHLGIAFGAYPADFRARLSRLCYRDRVH